MGDWWPNHWVPSCEQSVGGRQRREEAPCLQLRPPWCVSHSRMGSLPAWGPSGCAKPPRGAGTVVVMGAVS